MPWNPGGIYGTGLDVSAWNQLTQDQRNSLLVGLYGPGSAAAQAYQADQVRGAAQDANAANQAIAGLNNASAERIASGRNTTDTAIASGNNASAERIAGLNNASQQAIQGTAQQRHDWAAADWAQSNSAIQGLLQSLGLTNPDGTPAGGNGSPTGAATVGNTGMTQAELDAESSAFGRAKDRVGLMNEAAIRGLDSAMASRGITGSGVQGQLLQRQQAGGLQNLSEQATQQAQASLNRRYQVADRDVANATTRRGQNIAIGQSLINAYRPSSTGGSY